MTITWLGHACFLITLDDGRKIVTDPFDASVGYPAPKAECDIVTVSHAHHDHNATDQLAGYGVCLSEEGVFEFSGSAVSGKDNRNSDTIRISSVRSFHDEACGQKRGNNLIFKIEADGKTIVHLGDLGHITDESQTAFIKNADVLLIPIGGTYTITAEQAIEIINKASPVCAVPMHFLTKALAFPIADEKEFAKKTNAEYIKTNTANVNDLKGYVIFDY